MSEDTEWSTSSNEATTIFLTNKSDPTYDRSFQPAFTYPIFGNEETIFGYKGLRIKLDFTADTLKPLLDVSWQQKYTPVGETKADAVEEKLEPFLPSLKENSPPTTQPFEPPGDLLHKYEANGREFGIWSALLTDPAMKQILRHMQIFIPFFIEGGIPIELDDPEWTIDRWRIFLIYAIDSPATSPDTKIYTFAGYSTAYRVFYYDPNVPTSYTLSITDAHDPSTTPLAPVDPALPATLPSRQRISQFLILPPYQHASHGSQLYSTMLSHFLPNPSITEITVEDPNESFDALRDVNDLLRLRRSVPDFAALAINTDVKLPARSEPIPLEALVSTTRLEQLRRQCKIERRQFARLAEMQLLATIPPLHRSTSRITRRDRTSDPADRAYYFWRLVVRHRLYRKNADMLAQMEVEERVDELEKLMPDLEREYTDVLARVERRAARDGNAPADPPRKKLAKKRPIEAVEPARDADDDSPVSTVNGDENARKRAKKRVTIADDDDE